jgi:UrcA family protein
MTTDTTRTQISQRLLAAVAAGALALACAQAASATDEPTVTVRYDDLNLASPQGARVLYQRIVAAARAVCPEQNLRDVDQYRVSVACQDRAIERAVHAVHNPHLAAVARAAKG